MGITICPKHGPWGFYEVCEHVDAVFMKGNYQEFRCVINMLWCDDCWAKYDLARFENLADLFDEGVDVQLMIDDYESVYDKMQRRSWCQKCIDEFQATADGAVETHF